MTSSLYNLLELWKYFIQVQPPLMFYRKTKSYIDLIHAYFIMLEFFFEYFKINKENYSLQNINV